MENLQSFFEMGGYAFYIWTSYALAFFGLGGLLILSLRSKSKAQAELDRLRPPPEKTTSAVKTESQADNPQTDQGMNRREA